MILTCRPSSWTCLKIACVKWNRHPLMTKPGNTSRKACHTPGSKSATRPRKLGAGRRSFRAWNTYKINTVTMLVLLFPVFKAWMVSSWVKGSFTILKVPSTNQRCAFFRTLSWSSVAKRMWCLVSAWMSFWRKQFGMKSLVSLFRRWDVVSLTLTRYPFFFHTCISIK